MKDEKCTLFCMTLACPLGNDGNSRILDLVLAGNIKQKGRQALRYGGDCQGTPAFSGRRLFISLANCTGPRSL